MSFTATVSDEGIVALSACLFPGQREGRKSNPKVPEWGGIQAGSGGSFSGKRVYGVSGARAHSSLNGQGGFFHVLFDGFKAFGADDVLYPAGIGHGGLLIDS